MRLSVAFALAGPALAQTAVAPRLGLAFTPQESVAVADCGAEWALRVSPRLVVTLQSPNFAARSKALHAVGSLAYASTGGP